MIKEIKYKGLSTTPSDYECEDGHLAAASNVVNDADGIKTVPDIDDVIPVISFSAEYDPMGIHTPEGCKVYILWNNNTNKLCFYDTSEATPQYKEVGDVFTHKPTKILFVGYTIVVLSKEDDVRYYLYRAITNSYKFLGTHIPEVPLQFGTKIFVDSKTKAFVKPDDSPEVHFLMGVPGETNVSYYDSSMTRVAFYNAKHYEGESSPVFRWNMYNIDYSKSLPELGITQAQDALTYMAANTKTYVSDRTNEGYFTRPFLVRYALRLYDDTTLTMHSAPILITPCTTSPMYLAGHSKADMVFHQENSLRLRYWGFYIGICEIKALLQYNLLDESVKTTLMTDWKDIVKSVDIYISNPLDQGDNVEATYEKLVTGNEPNISYSTVTNGNDPFVAYCVGLHNESGIKQSYKSQQGWQNFYQKWSIADIWRSSVEPSGQQEGYFPFQDVAPTDDPVTTKLGTWPISLGFKQRSNSDYITNVTNATLHLFQSIPIKDLSASVVTFTKDEHHYDLPSVYASRAMYDEYLSHDTLSAKTGIAYNGRVLLSNISRNRFEGFSPKTMLQKVTGQWDYLNNGANHPCSISLSFLAEDNSGNVITHPTYPNEYSQYIYHNNSTIPNSGAYPLFIYLPNIFGSKAYLQVVDATHSNKYEAHLEGCAWNGKCYFGGLFSNNITPIASIPETTNRHVEEKNGVLMSNANNIFVFEAQNMLNVGIGEILEVGVNTKPLSQGQYGKYNITVFATDGLWSLDLNTDGTIATSSPMPRDVIFKGDNGVGFVSQLDDSLLFSTMSGIMLLQGNVTEVLSNQFDENIDDILSKEPFASIIAQGSQFGGGTSFSPAMFMDYIKKSKAIFDYVNKRIIVFNTERSTTPALFGWYNTQLSQLPIYTKSANASVGDTTYNSNGESVSTVAFKDDTVTPKEIDNVSSRLFHLTGNTVTEGELIYHEWKCEDYIPARTFYTYEGEYYVGCDIVDSEGNAKGSVLESILVGQEHCISKVSSYCLYNYDEFGEIEIEQVKYDGYRSNYTPTGEPNWVHVKRTDPSQIEPITSGTTLYDEDGESIGSVGDVYTHEEEGETFYSFDIEGHKHSHQEHFKRDTTKDLGYKPSYEYAYVFSIKTRTWSMIKSTFVESINAYPYSYLVDYLGNIYNSTDIKSRVVSGETQKANTGWFLTRPISLGDPNMPKVIDYIKQNGVFANYRTMTTPERNELPTLYAWGESVMYIYTKSSTPSHGDATYDSNGNVYPNRTVDAYTAGDPSIDVEEPGGETYTWDRCDNADVFQNDTAQYARDNNAFVSDSIQQVLFGSNDLVNWVVISSSRSHRISDYSGSPYKWFRLAVKCSFKPGESLSSVTFSFRNKFSNDKLI